MKIIIAGAGAVGTHLAKLFSRERHDITLIDDNPERLEGIGSNFEMLTICDSPSSIETLKRADVGKADLFIGVTPDEAHNMTCCMLASKLGAAKTVARVDNYEYTRPEHRDFFKTVGIDSIIYPEMLAGREIMHNACHSWVRQWLEIQNGALLMPTSSTFLSAAFAVRRRHTTSWPSNVGSKPSYPTAMTVWRRAIWPIL